MKRVILVLFAVALAVSACTGSDAVDQTANSTFQFKSGTPVGRLYPQAQRKRAEDFTAKLIGGGTVKLAASKGKIVVLNFWAAWCGPCRTESPQFDAVYRRIKSRGVDFFGIDTKDVRGNAESFIKDNDISYPIIYDEQGETALRLGNLPATALPFTVLIDRRGRVAAVYVARMSGKDLRIALDKLLAEPAHAAG